MPNVPPAPGATPTSYGAVPAGYDATKWNSGHSSAKYVAGRAVASGARSDADIIRALIAGGHQARDDARAGDDRFEYFDPEVGRWINIDGIGDIGGQNFPVWYPRMGGADGYASDGLRDDGSVNTRPGGARPGGSGSGGSGAPGTGVDYGGVDFPSAEMFSDPATQALEAFFRLRLEDLLAEDQRPDRERFQGLLRDRTTALGDINSNPDVAASVNYNRSRFNELQGDPFTGTEEKAMRVDRFDRMEQEREAEKRRIADTLMRQGHAPTSGTVLEAIRRVDDSYDRQRAASENELLLYTADERQARGREAVDLGDFIQNQTEGRRREQLTTAGLASDVEALSRSEEEARRREALSVAALPVELSTNRLQLALQALGMGGNPQSVLSALLGINNAATQENIANSSQRSSGLQGLGNLLSILSTANFSGRSQTPQTGA